jgi:hypothetical protein
VRRVPAKEAGWCGSDDAVRNAVASGPAFSGGE